GRREGRRPRGRSGAAVRSPRDAWDRRRGGDRGGRRRRSRLSRPAMPMTSVMVVAGEASGDGHGAALCAAIRRLSPATRVFGMGGERMRAAGADLVADVSRRATVGGTEAVSGVSALYRVLRRLRRVLTEERPDVVVLIDFPEFNLRLAGA